MTNPNDYRVNYCYANKRGKPLTMLRDTGETARCAAEAERIAMAAAPEGVRVRSTRCRYGRWEVHIQHDETKPAPAWRRSSITSAPREGGTPLRGFFEI